MTVFFCTRKLVFQSEFPAVFTASNIIAWCTTRYPLHLQLMLGDQLEMQSVLNGHRNLLSACRLAPSLTYSDKLQYKGVVQSLLKSVQRGSNNMLLLNGDNISFIRKGAEASYPQWVLFQDIVLWHNWLNKLNMLLDDSNERLSRQPDCDWIESCAILRRRILIQEAVL